MPSLPAILYHPDGYSTRGTRPMGRRVAGEQFLRALAGHALATGAPRLTCYTAEVDMARVFASDVRAAGFRGGLRVVPFGSEGRLAEDGTLYAPDPGLARLAFQRERVGRGAYSLSGVIHTLASTATIDLIAQMVSAPLMPWDVLVCTSRAGRAVVLDILGREEAWLAERFGAASFVRPELPLIPLPVPTGDFAGATARRAEARVALGIAPNARVVVFVGRLSLHAKAHPLPMYLALAEVARAAPADGARGPVVLVECGSYGDPSAAAGFGTLRAAFPELTFVTVGGERAARDDERLAALAAADVFASLADNVQETFGLSVIEAMAAGLPVVVSDWDGYKDTVRDGVDGVRVPTGFPTGGGADLMRDYDLERLDYDHYVGHLSQLCAVDVGAAAGAFGALLGNPARARAMGAAAAEHARAEYDGAVVLARYQELWDELARRRQAAPASAGRRHPRRPVPSELYASFPTGTTPRATAFALAAQPRWELLAAEAVAVVAGPVISAARVAAWRDRLHTHAQVVAASDEELAELHVLWKYGLVRPAT